MTVTIFSLPQCTTAICESQFANMLILVQGWDTAMLVSFLDTHTQGQWTEYEYTTDGQRTKYASERGTSTKKWNNKIPGFETLHEVPSLPSVWK